MSFSRLLLVAANSKKFISGEGKDKVQISPKMVSSGRDPYEGEVILCFQLDDPADQEKRVSRSLGIPGNSPRCDGLVFYSQDGETGRVICLVPLKIWGGGASGQKGTAKLPRQKTWGASELSFFRRAGA